MQLVGGYKSDIGNTRDINQDSVTLCIDNAQNLCFAVLAVCDGIGGLEHGEIASLLVTRGVENWYEEVLKWIDIKTVDSEVLFAHLKDAAEEWNQSVLEYAKSHNLRMGTTMTLLMIVRDSYYIINVGDSRIYSFHENKLSQLTVDATVSRMKNGKLKQYLDNYMGKSQELWFTSAKGKVRMGDMFVACTDGLYHRLTPEDIAEVYSLLLLQTDINKVCEDLIHKQIGRGEKDNISVGVVLLSQDKKQFRPFGKRLR